MTTSSTTESKTLATPNYGYEKRQRELAKKKKKEEKLRAKTDRKFYPQDGQPENGAEGAAGEPGEPEQAAPAA